MYKYLECNRLPFLECIENSFFYTSINYVQTESLYTRKFVKRQQVILKNNTRPREYNSLDMRATQSVC